LGFQPLYTHDRRRRRYLEVQKSMPSVYGAVNGEEDFRSEAAAAAAAAAGVAGVHEAMAELKVL
jgi:hypothetical protein